MPKRQLDDDLLGKQETKTGKSKQYLREQISRKAGKFGVSSLAAQLIWAKQMGFGITQALNRTSPEVREEVRSAQSPPPIRGGGHIAPGKNGRLKKGKPITGATIDTLLRDQQLTKRYVTNVHGDLRRLSDIGLIEEKKKDGQTVKKDGFTLYEKTPLARTVPISYFSGPTKLVRPVHSAPGNKQKIKRPQALAVPSENELLDMCKKGEDQTLEFKAAGTDVRKITKEIAAMLNTRQGGMIFYAVEDDGTIQGSDVTRQQFDQPLQNSVKNSIAPAASMTLSQCLPWAVRAGVER